MPQRKVQNRLPVGWVPFKPCSALYACKSQAQAAKHQLKKHWTHRFVLPACQFVNNEISLTMCSSLDLPDGVAVLSIWNKKCDLQYRAHAFESMSNADSASPKYGWTEAEIDAALAQLADCNMAPDMMDIEDVEAPASPMMMEVDVSCSLNESKPQLNRSTGVSKANSIRAAKKTIAQQSKDRQQEFHATAADKRRVKELRASRNVAINDAPPCKHCKAHLFVGESRTMCCGGGKRAFKLSDVLEPLKRLVKDLCTRSKAFRKLARQYNHRLSFVTLGVRDGGITKFWSGEANLSIHGTTYHKFRVVGECSTVYTSWYILDPHTVDEELLKTRINGVDYQLCQELNRELRHMLRTYNPLAQSYIATYKAAMPNIAHVSSSTSNEHNSDSKQECDKNLPDHLQQVRVNNEQAADDLFAPYVDKPVVLTVTRTPSDFNNQPITTYWIHKVILQTAEYRFNPVTSLLAVAATPTPEPSVRTPPVTQRETKRTPKTTKAAKAIDTSETDEEYAPRADTQHAVEPKRKSKRKRKPVKHHDTSEESADTNDTDTDESE